MTRYMTMKLPEGWHDLNTEDRLKSLLNEVGIQVEPEQIERALDEMAYEKGRIYEVHPDEIKWRGSMMYGPSRRNITKQMERLQAEGQIEPIQVFQCVNHGALEVQEDAWAYAEAQVEAAKELNWPTLLVTLDEE